jgi:nitrogenase-associated protein
MSHLVFFEKPGCGGNARQRATLEAAGHTLERRNLLTAHWTPEALLAFLAPLPVPQWFNRAAPRIKSGEVVPEALDAVNRDGNNALWLACVHGDLSGIERLVRAGVPIDQTNTTGATALMYASSSGKAAVLRQLLALGADASLRTQDDFSALDMAASVECLRLLRPQRAPALSPSESLP